MLAACLLASAPARQLLLAQEQGGSAGHGEPLSEAVPPDTVLHVPAATTLDDPVVFPHLLTPGERLLVQVEGRVKGFAPDSGGEIGSGALVASFAGSPMFSMDGRRLLWSAPSQGRLGFAVAQGTAGDLSGGYSVGLAALGQRGDPRQRRFPPPRIAFAPRVPQGPFLRVIYEDVAGFGLDRKTLQVILDAESGERVVLSPYFMGDSTGAVLPVLPPDVKLPRGVHRVTATIADALGNVSREVRIFLDQP